MKSLIITSAIALTFGIANANPYTYSPHSKAEIAQDKQACKSEAESAVTFTGVAKSTACLLRGNCNVDSHRGKFVKRCMRNKGHAVTNKVLTKVEKSCRKSSRKQVKKVSRNYTQQQRLDDIYNKTKACVTIEVVKLLSN